MPMLTRSGESVLSAAVPWVPMAWMAFLALVQDRQRILKVLMASRPNRRRRRSVLLATCRVHHTYHPLLTRRVRHRPMVHRSSQRLRLNRPKRQARRRLHRLPHQLPRQPREDPQLRPWRTRPSSAKHHPPDQGRTRLRLPMRMASSQRRRTLENVDGHKGHKTSCPPSACALADGH